MKSLRAHPMTNDSGGHIPPDSRAIQNTLYRAQVRLQLVKQNAEDGLCYLVRRGRRRPITTRAQRIILSILSSIPTAHPRKQNSFSPQLACYQTLFAIQKLKWPVTHPAPEAASPLPSIASLPPRRQLVGQSPLLFTAIDGTKEAILKSLKFQKWNGS